MSYNSPDLFSFQGISVVYVHRSDNKTHYIILHNPSLLSQSEKLKLSIIMFAFSKFITGVKLPRHLQKKRAALCKRLLQIAVGMTRTPSVRLLVC